MPSSKFTGPEGNGNALLRSLEKRFKKKASGKILGPGTGLLEVLLGGAGNRGGFQWPPGDGPKYRGVRAKKKASEQDNPTDHRKFDPTRGGLKRGTSLQIPTSVCGGPPVLGQLRHSQKMAYKGLASPEGKKNTWCAGESLTFVGRKSGGDRQGGRRHHRGKLS